MREVGKETSEPANMYLLPSQSGAGTKKLALPTYGSVEDTEKAYLVYHFYIIICFYYFF